MSERHEKLTCDTCIFALPRRLSLLHAFHRCLHVKSTRNPHRNHYHTFLTPYSCPIVHLHGFLRMTKVVCSQRRKSASGGQKCTWWLGWGRSMWARCKYTFRYYHLLPGGVKYLSPLPW